MSFKRNVDIMAWDNEGKTADRYTIAIIDPMSGWNIYTMSERPSHPQGVNMFSHNAWAFNPTIAWGKRTAINSLPLAVRKAIKERAKNE